MVPPYARAESSLCAILYNDRRENESFLQIKVYTPHVLTTNKNALLEIRKGVKVFSHHIRRTVKPFVGEDKNLFSHLAIDCLWADYGESAPA